MSIIYSTLERLENLEKEGHARADRSRSGNTKAEGHHPVLSPRPGFGIAFKIVVSIMLCLGGAAILVLRTNVPAQLNTSLFSQSQAMETEPSIAANPEFAISGTSKPALPAMVSPGEIETDGIPVGAISEPEIQPNDQIDPLVAELEVASDLTPARVVEVSSVEAGLSQAQAVELPNEASEAEQSANALVDNSVALAVAERHASVDNSAALAEAEGHASSDISAVLAEADRHASDEQSANVNRNSEAQPALSATTTEVRPDPIGQTLEQARLALSRGQYFQALADIESLSPVPENRADFWFIKGSVHLGLGQLDLAEDSFESAQALVPGHAQTLVQLAVLKQEKGDHAGAITLLKDAALRHRDVPEIYLNLGYSQQALGVFDEAGRSFRIFLELTEGRSVYSEQRKMVSQWVARGPA